MHSCASDARTRKNCMLGSDSWITFGHSKVGFFAAPEQLLQASSLDVFSMPFNGLRHPKIEFYENFTEFCHIFTELCDKVIEFYSFC